MCLPRVFLCVCLCVRGVSVACGCRSLLPPAGAVVAVDGGVAGVCCGWSLATPSGGSCVRFPATPGWVSLPVVVGVPRHSWLRAAGAVPRHSWLGSAGGGGVRSLATPVYESWLRLPATPGWGLPVAVGCSVGGGVPCCVFFGVCGCAWWPCCGVFCVFVVSLLLVVWFGGVAWVCLPHVCSVPLVCGWFSPPLSVRLAAGVCVGLVGVCCGSPATSIERPVCGAPPLLAGVCRCAAVVGPLPLLAEEFGCGAPPLLAGVRQWVWSVVPRHSWPRAAGVVPHHCWLGSAGCGGGGLPAALGPGVPHSLALVCVCVLCGASCWSGWCVGVVRGVVAVCVCVCVWCFLFLGVSYLGQFASSVGMVKAKKQKESRKERPCRCVAEMRVCTCIWFTYLSICPIVHFSCCRERACAGCWVLVGCGTVLPLPLWFLFFFLCFPVVLYLFTSVAGGWFSYLCFLLRPVFFWAVIYLPYLVHPLDVIPCASPIERVCAYCAGGAGAGVSYHVCP